ncbi:MAG: response regulator [Lachnospiraceae bacterium]|nr:response regulator [Lachnospiraceae bacterium]
MKFNIDFEILGSIVTLVIAYNFRMNYVARTRSDKAFINMVYWILASQILDMVSAITISIEKPEWNVINHILTSGYFIAGFVTAVAFERYVVSYIAEVTRSKTYEIFRRTVIILLFAFSLSNPLTGLQFSFDTEGIYHHGSLYVVGYIAPALFMIASLFFIVLYRRCFSKRQWISCMVFVIVVFVAMTIQLVFLTELYLTFGVIPIALLMVMFSLETPDYRKLINTLTELEKAKQEALAANKVKSEFLANMSHEIRTPINSMLGFNEMILRETDEKEVFSYASNIKKSGQTLLSLVNDILDLSKVEAGKMEIINGEYDTAYVTKDLVSMIKPRVDEKGLELKLNIDSKIPKRLSGDVVRIGQILMNLLTNAVKYTKKGEVLLTVSLKGIKGDKANLFFEVKDTGMGIKKENIEKLFSEFSRVEEKTHAIEGTGLGIPITVKFLKLMNSKLEVESTVGKGSAFSFLLEQKVIDPTPAGEIDFEDYEPETDINVFREDFTAPGVRVLVVDDVPMNLLVFKGLLKQSLMNIDTAAGGLEAIELIRKNDYDIVFLDHQMPEMDGITTLEKLKTEYPDRVGTIPYIALTANAISGARDMYIKSGFSDYLTKPIDVSALTAIFRKWLPAEKIKEAPVSHKKTAEKKDSVQATVWDLEKAGINVQSGLGYASNDTDFYLEILHDYVASFGETKEVLLDSLSKKDLKNYEIKVHSLKGTSKTIGALDFAEKAKALEYAAKDENMELIEAENDNMLKAYEELVEKIEEITCRIS